MTELIFPTIRGQGWPTTKKPSWASRVSTAVNGRELRTIDQLYPKWFFTLPVDILTDGLDTRGTWSVGYANELRPLMDFFNTCYGRGVTFLYTDPTDHSVVGQFLLPGDGVTTAFQLLRTMVNFIEPMTAPNTVTAVYVNNILIPPLGNWTVDPLTGILNFITPPGNGLSVKVDFSYYFRCHFSEDNIEFENFMIGRWNTKSELKFESVLA